MSKEETLKRKSVELAPDDVDEASDEPQQKIMKGEEGTSKHNLENSPVQSNTKNEAHESPLVESTTEKESPIDAQSEIPRSISIKFHNKAISDLYKTKFLEFINSFIELQVGYEDVLSIEVYKDDVVNSDEWVVIDDADKVEGNASIVVETTTDLVVETDTSVVVETAETPVPSKKRKKRSKAKKELFVVDATPSPKVAQADLRYTTKFTINTEKSTKEAADRPSKQTCFNCDQFHALKDCPKPKDYTRINIARQKLFRQQPKSSRYHLEEDQKYSHLEPGKLSDQLRNALGLYKNEAPHYIYLMRKLGYPPGWLEEAKFVHSNLNMFDIDGNHVKASGGKKGGLDAEKIVEFPGFNVPFEKGVKDDYRKFGVPPFSDDFSKDAMINFYDQKFAKEEDSLETCDMDIDHEERLENKNVEIDQRGNRDSPSLVDLEQQKLQLLEELNDDEGKVDDKNSLNEKDFLRVKQSSFGTPILKSNSPYLTLPNADNFSKDVSPVINFENLPNSTGKYEQMTDVLQKVRSTLKKIHSG